jgi:catechol 2,3-dioxygenase-like lactoylglutathione lyase family enzyme
MSVPKIAAIRLVCDNVATTASFYSRAFDARSVAGNGLTTVTLGEQQIELVATGSESRLVAPSNSTAFQHCAIVVSDMAAAMSRLRTCPGWSAISRSGAETLPKSSGGVIAFKFRDPEGHPLEFLQFPDDSVPLCWNENKQLFLGIDHTAITIANTEQSARFYANLGFSIIKGQMNEGLEQQRLDDVTAPSVEVTALEIPEAKPPHLELLHYRHPGTIVEVAPVTDIRSTRLILDVSGFEFSELLLANYYLPEADRDADGQETWLRDPDGHILILRGVARKINRRDS